MLILKIDKMEVGRVSFVNNEFFEIFHKVKLGKVLVWLGSEIGVFGDQTLPVRFLDGVDKSTAVNNVNMFVGFKEIIFVVIDKIKRDFKKRFNAELLDVKF